METNLQADSTGRESLDPYLENAIPLPPGELSTQVSLSATSVTTGGITGKFLIKDTGSLVVVDRTGTEVIVIDRTGITINDGTNDRVKLGDIS